MTGAVFDNEREHRMAQRRPKTITPPIQEVPRIAEPGDELPPLSSLQISAEGLALLRDRLRAANDDNPDFEAQFGRHEDVLRTLIRRLADCCGAEIARVVAFGEWAQLGFDLRTMPYTDVVVLIVVPVSEASFDLHLRIADKGFTGLEDEGIFVQFRLETLASWRRAEAIAQANGTTEALGIPLTERV
jgi:hypothetical protein